jgi:hypothetical protein
VDGGAEIVAGGAVVGAVVVVAGDVVVGVVAGVPVAGVVVAGWLMVVLGVAVVVAGMAVVAGVQGAVLVTEAPGPLVAVPLAGVVVVWPLLAPTWLLLVLTWLLLLPTWLLLVATCEPEGVTGVTQGFVTAPALPLWLLWFGVASLVWGALLILGDPIVMPGVPPLGGVLPVVVLWVWVPVVPVVVAPVWLPVGVDPTVPGLVCATAIAVATNKVAVNVIKRLSMILLSASPNVWIALRILDALQGCRDGLPELEDSPQEFTSKRSYFTGGEG